MKEVLVMGDNLSVADAMALASSTKDNCNDGMWGGNGMWVLFLFFLMAWGNGGFWGNRNGMNDAAVQGALTRSDLFEGFNTQDINSQLRGITNGLADSTYAVNNGIKDLGVTTLQGFNATQMGMMQGFDGTNQRLTDLGYQVQSCCCQTNRNLDSVKYENAKNTCDIINAVNASAQRVIDQMTTDKIDDLRTELQSAQLQLSNNSQTANLIATLRPFPQPAYTTCSPYTSSNAGCCYGGVA